ncbi:MAG: putative toxin-antitoxin system toxin component, PIN family [Pyrinomonadaceae bacterium]|nr:putative toxin-antitoxin system toxin component, PIN family [Pyrinomonadaceae bacterium]
MPSDQVKVIFDCNTFVQALLSPDGAAAASMELVRRGEIALYVSPQVLAEIRDVLQRPVIMKRLPSLTIERVQAFLEDVVAHATTIRNVPAKFRYERDPEDEPYINLAAVAGADYIVSRDRDLLDLMTGTSVECKEFRQRFRPLKVVQPLEFLREVAPDQS